MPGPCTDCFTGKVHSGVPTGQTSTIHGLSTYVARPKDGGGGVAPKGIVVMIPDAFGWEFVNNRLLCDRYAEQGGFLVYLPDFMNGTSLPFRFVHLMEEKVKKPANWLTTIFCKPFYLAQALGLGLPWLFKNRQSVCRPRIVRFFQDLRTCPPPFPTHDLKVGAAGFCWGGLYTILLTHDTPSSRVRRHASQTLASTGPQPLLDCGFVAHPSMVSVPKHIEAIRLPMSVAVGKEDMAMKAPQVSLMKKILESRKEGHHEVVLMPGAKHGFAIRLDPGDQLQAKYAEEAEVQAVDWFARWFS